MAKTDHFPYLQFFLSNVGSQKFYCSRTIEELFNYKESKKLEEKLIRSYIEGNHSVMRKHWFMFDENLDNNSN